MPMSLYLAQWQWVCMAHVNALHVYSCMSSQTHDIIKVGCCFIGNVLVICFRNGLPLWSSGQSSWLQTQRPGFDSRQYQMC
jgi:hypothetical protein